MVEGRTPKDTHGRIVRGISTDDARVLIHDPRWRLERELPLACARCGEYPAVSFTRRALERGAAMDNWGLRCRDEGCATNWGAGSRKDLVDLWNRWQLKE